MEKSDVFGYGEWKERVMSDIIAFQTLHCHKPSPEETDSPRYYEEAIQTYNRQTIGAHFIETLLIQLTF